MVYKRQEGFRYSFNNPISCMFKIMAIDHNPVTTDFGMADIIDMSPGGLKLKSNYNLPTNLKDIEVEIHLTLHDELLVISGNILWQKKDVQNKYVYGIKLETDEQMQSRIVDELKQHARVSLSQ